MTGSESERGAREGDAETTVRLSVPEMDCPSCADTVEASVRELDGIEAVEPHATTGTLVVTYDPDRTGPDEIRDRVEAAGYAVASDEGAVSETVTVPEMDCPSCAETVGDALEALPGVTSYDTRPTSGTVVVTYDGSGVSTDEVTSAIEDAGYEVTDVTREDAGGTVASTDDVWTSGRAKKTWIGGLLTFFGLLLEFVITNPALLASPVALSVADVLFLAAVAVSGQEIVRGGYRSLLNRSLDIDLLMTIAIAGALVVSVAFGKALYLEAATLAVLFSLAELLERYSMERTRDSLQELMDLSPDEATVRREGEERTVPVEEVRVGDVVVVRPGERIPMDGVVVEGDSAVNQAPITGESVPVDKTGGDEVYAGTINEQGYLEVEVTAEAADTTLSRIVELVEDAQANRTEKEQFVDRFAGYYTPVVVAFAVLVTLGAPSVLGVTWAQSIVYGLTLLVLACPCAFVISTPVSVVSGITSAARHGVLVKGGDHLEAMGAVEAVALDKTGTLTKGELVVTDVVPLNDNTEAEVLRCARGVEARSEHPIAEAIVDRADERGLDRGDVEDFESITGKGVRADVAGTTHYAGKPGLFESLGFDLTHVHAATDGGVVTTRSQRLCERNDCLDLLEETVPALQAEGKTVVLVGTEDELEGVIAVADELRPGARRAVERLHELGVERVVMLTGDNERTARAIATAVGVDDFRAELLPEEKVEAIEDLKAALDGVAMVGDGVNDAPALATATVGVAMGAVGTDTAIETADIALMGDDLSRLPYLYELSNDANGVIRQNIWTSLGAKAALALAVPFGLVPIWAAVLIGDAGMTVGVTGNAMRLSRVAPETDLPSSASLDTDATHTEEARRSMHDHDHDDGHAGGGHADLASGGGTSTRRLAAVAAVNFVGFVVELAGGLLFGSVALIGDAVHMLFDMLAYAMAFGASYTAERFEGGEEWSYGLHRLEPVAALLNGVLLLPMVGYILWESYHRFLEPVAIDPVLTLVIATGGLLVNLGSVLVLGGEEMSLNERGAFYHLLGDAGGSVAVIVSTAAVALFDLRVADPVAAVAIAALVLWSAVRVLRESSAIVLQRSPVPIADLRADLRDVEGVERVADVHAWQVCSQLSVATVRVVDGATTLEDREAVRARIHALLAEAGFDHATVELTGGDGDATGNDHAH